MTLRNEFKPPSDFVGDSSGSGGGKSIWKVLGIGCAVIILLMGAFLACGAWKTFSFCSDFVEKGSLLREFSSEVVVELKNEEFDKVRARMAPALAGRISEEQLAIQRREYARYFENATPYISQVNMQDTNIWRVGVDLAPPASTQKLVILMEIDIANADSGNASDLVLTSLVFEQQERNLRAEGPAVAVLDFHRNLRADNPDAAFELLATTYGDIGAFRAFLEDQKPVFSAGDVKIESVDSRLDGARVVALIGEPGAEQVRVVYELGLSTTRMGQYELQKITPTYLKAAAAADVAGEEADAGVEELAPPDIAEESE